MRSFKDMIARRRPTGPIRKQAVSEPEESGESAQPAMPVRTMTREPLYKSAIDPDSARKKARAARDRIPTPPAPPPVDKRDDWTERASTPPGQTPAKRKVWDLEPATATSTAQTQVTADTGPSAPAIAAQQADATSLPTSPDGHSARRKSKGQGANRAKTRLLGFHGEAPGQDIFAISAAAGAASDPMYPIGWLVVIDGPGRGASFTLTAGLSTIGRDADQTISLDFGDTSISRENHVAIAHDEEDGRSYVGHGGKANIVRLNDQPLLTTEDLGNGDTLRVGKTTLRFVAFCDDTFTWGIPDGDTQEDA